MIYYCIMVLCQTHQGRVWFAYYKYNFLSFLICRPPRFRVFCFRRPFSPSCFPVLPEFSPPVFLIFAGLLAFSFPWFCRSFRSHAVLLTSPFLVSPASALSCSPIFASRFLISAAGPHAFANRFALPVTIFHIIICAADLHVFVYRLTLLATIFTFQF